MTSSKRTKIVCTIGPSSRDVATLFKMGQAGMDVARLNFSHGTHDDHRQMMKHLDLVGKRLGQPFAILQDLQGPKIRVGELPKQGIHLVTGKSAIFHTGNDVPDGEIPVTLATLHRDVRRGEHLLLDDGLLEVEVTRVDGHRILTEVVQGGLLTSHKGINLPHTVLRLPALSEKDRSDAMFGIKLGVDMIALSFVRSAQDVLDLRRVLARGGERARAIRVIAKIEKQEAVDHFDEILACVDGVMVARGDLGIETPAASVPVIQKQIVTACRLASKPVIVATQMLDSMINHPRATRAEVSDVANAVADHVDAVMLSGETASGSYPVEAVRVMTDTIRATESSTMDDVNPFDVTPTRDLPEVIGGTVRILVEALGRPPVVVATASGRTAHEVSSFRPETSIFALTFDPHIQRFLRLVWGVESYLLPRKRTPELMIEAGLHLLKKSKKIKKGQRVILVTGSASGKPGTANRIEIAVA